MKQFLVILFLITNWLVSQSQKIFAVDPEPGISLSGASGSCAVPGASTPNVFSVSVSGIGTMNSTNQLLLSSIALSDCGTGTKNYSAVQIRIMSPSGICYGIYNGGLTPLGSGTHYLNLVSSTPCLNNPNTSNDINGGSPFLGTGNNGYFNAQFGGVATNYANFTGNADGDWKIIFSESTSSPPCVESIRLVFGDPKVINQGTDGDNCDNAIVWDGKSPICASTNLMTGSTQMPGSLTGPNTGSFSTSIGGTACSWNGANNNDVWIKYVATASNVCLSISGVSGVGVSLQTLVVTDANADNDGQACTQNNGLKTVSNDPYWSVVSCPRNTIYGTTAGTQYNQQHCFTTEINKTYYLIVDGDGGAVSKFWVSGFSYNGFLNMKDYEYIHSKKDYEDPKVNLSSDGFLYVDLHKTINTYEKQIIQVYNSQGSLLHTKTVNIYRDKESNIFIDQYTTTGLNYIKVMLVPKFGESKNYVLKYKKN